MAQIQADGGFDAPEDRIALGTLASWAGAAVSLALVVGIGVWGYQLVTRDVSGIPVVRAAEGPMRIQPQDPGGAAAVNQGLAVNMVPAKGSAEKPADRLILAPKPIDLSEDDLSAAQLASQSVIQETPEEPAPAGMSVDDIVASVVRQDQQPERIENASLSVSEPSSAKPLGGLAQSLRPQPRPASLVRPLASVALDMDPAQIPAGERLAQLGAFEDADQASKEWDRLYARFGDYMAGKKRVIQKAESGGRTFYRLRAYGFADISDARRFCSALVAEKAECIPVSSR
ncbi:SPOR domain-containing protein [Thalassovita sp.]|uniref:SPOR domain-containing protein n=1 Tax=Thalassovita sp. TaxID=1979401 RepID=UPI0029DE6177|nr:SPOR domain-containing protein [Thalassovita sp.]